MPMTLTIIEKLLEERIGLSADTIGSDLIAKTVQKRQKACKLQTLEQYLAFLHASKDEWDELVETVLVPETWFFRHENSFLFLADYIRTEWMGKTGSRILRLLSIPCSSGEEPYSIAMTLFELGLSQENFQLDAVDVSRKNLQKARLGSYGRESFRGAREFTFRDRFFQRDGNSYQIHHTLQDAVNFIQGNLLDLKGWKPIAPYNVIFCRNVLIYLGQAAKTKVVHTLDRLLTKEGILFVGHAERPVFKGLPFTWVSQPGVFACRRHETEPMPAAPTRQTENPVLRPPQTVPPESQHPREIPRFERRRTERATLKPDSIRATENTSAETSYSDVERREDENKNTTRLDMARQLADRGKLAEALETCEHVIEKEPANVQAYFLKGLIFQALRNETELKNF